MTLSKTIFGMLMLSAILVGQAACADSLDPKNCLTAEENNQLNKYFWEEFPSGDQFSAYASPKVDVGSNLIELVNAKKSNMSGPDIARLFSAILSDNPDQFLIVKNAHEPQFNYFLGLPSVDSFRSSSKFPTNHCVSLFGYDYGPGACIAGQRIRVFGIWFEKKEGKVKLNDLRLFIEKCQ